MGYVVRRCLLLVPTLFGVTLVTFLLSVAAPGNPADTLIRRLESRPPAPGELEAMEKELGLDRPLVSQYLHWVAGAARGDLGTSFSTRAPVARELGHRIPFTLQLAVPAAFLALVLAVPLGTFCALHRNRLADQVVRVASLATASLPSFWLALLLILAFSVHLGLVPVAGRGGPDTYLLPVLTLALEPAAVLARLTRSTMLETLGEDYVRTARSKGLRSWVVVGRHAMRNAMIPAVTYFGSRFAGLLTGAVLVETIFVWPGLGQLTVNAVGERDYPMIQGLVLFAGVTFAVLNLLVDLSYGLIDPRIRLGRKAVRAG